MLVEHGASVNLPDGLNCTPLWTALQAEELDVVKWLAARGANAIDGDWDVQNELLFGAIHLKKTKALKWMLSFGYDVCATRGNGTTPLHIASADGNLGIVKVLLEAGADPNAASQGWSVFQDVCLCGHSSGLKSMNLGVCSGNFQAMNNIHLGLDVPQLLHLTPIIIAAGLGELEIIKALHQNGARITADAIIVACWFGRTDVAEYFIEHDLDLSVNGSNGLVIACGHGYLATAEMLVNRGADVNATTERGLTALHFAARTGDLNAITWLVRHSANLEARTFGPRRTVRGDVTLEEGGLTPLHFAALHGHLGAVMLLVQLGADSNVVSDAGGTALTCAAQLGRLDMVRWLCQYADPNLLACPRPLHVARQADVVEYLLDVGAKGNIHEMLPAVPHTGCDLSILELLLHRLSAAKTYVDKYYAAKAKRTAVMRAVGSRHTESLKVLLDYDAPVEGVDAHSTTALHHACSDGTLTAVQALVEAGADVEAKCFAGSRLATPLHFAEINRRHSVVRYLKGLAKRAK
ncbi:ankyrin repeat-containing domain protein [Zopfochytrium polystomum]|nr:ankyrin repeat-containing domain protein [Zopfochytrium polystomum]